MNRCLRGCKALVLGTVSQALWFWLGAWPALAQDAEPTSQQQENTIYKLPKPGRTVSWVPQEPEDPSDSTSKSEFTLPPVQFSHTKKTHRVSVFPLYFSRTTPDDSEYLVGLYYRRRSPKLNVDVAAPFYWSFRDPYNTTTVLPPFHYRYGTGFDVGLTPLFYHGREKEKHYTVIPPLLTVSWRDQMEARTFSALLFWRLRDQRDINWGIFPFLWVKDAPDLEHVIAPPLFFRFVDHQEQDAFTLVPPVYHQISLKSVDWGVVPFVFHSHGENYATTTIPPLFHLYDSDKRYRLLTLLGGYLEDEASNSLYALLYIRHRGDTKLDAVAPIFWHWREPRMYASSLIVAPLFWHFQNPASQTTLALPFFGLWKKAEATSTWATLLAAHWENYAKEASTTWVFPTFQYSEDPTSRTFNFHPLFYSTGAHTHRNLVIAPIYWDFENYEEDYRTSIVFPVFWRFRDRATVHQVAGLTYYNEGRRHGEPYWQFHLFPFFAYGEPKPGDHWWTVLYGLAGYRRQGSYARAQFLWLGQVQTDGPE